MKQNSTSRPTPSDQARPAHRAGPAGGRLAVGLDAVGDAGQQHGQAETAGRVPAQSSSAGVRSPSSCSAAERPDRADDADRHADPEDRLPVPFAAALRRSTGPGTTRRPRPPC